MNFIIFLIMSCQYIYLHNSYTNSQLDNLGWEKKKTKSMHNEIIILVIIINWVEKNQLKKTDYTYVYCICTMKAQAQLMIQLHISSSLNYGLYTCTSEY